MRKFSLLYRLSIAAVVSGAMMVATGAVADEEHGHMDALVYQDGGKVQMGFIDVDCFGGAGEPGCEAEGEVGNYVYEAELEEGGNPVGSIGLAEEPGFFSIPTGGEAALPAGGSLLPANAAHSMSMVYAPSSLGTGLSILYWDGLGAVNFGAVPNAETFTVEGNNASGGILNGASVLSGIELDSTSSNSFFDTHPDFTLNGSGASDPTDGFYAVFGVTHIAGLSSSDKWGVVFGFGFEDEEAHEAAVDVVAAAVPEPGTALLMGLGLAGLAVNGRRRS